MNLLERFIFLIPAGDQVEVTTRTIDALDDLQRDLAALLEADPNQCRLQSSWRSEKNPIKQNPEVHLLELP